MRANSTYFYFDRGNRLTEVLDPLGSFAYWRYDANSNLIKTVDNLATAIYFGYDALDRRTTIMYPTENQYFGFDAGGNLTAMSDAWGASYFGFDGLGRMTARRTPRNDGGVFDAVYYTFDAASNNVVTQYPQDGATAYFGFDNAQRMSSILTPANNPVYFGYDASSNIAAKGFANTTAVYYTYDAAERVNAIRYLHSNGSELVTFEYARDAAGNILRIGRETDCAIYYSYDAVNRLTSEIWRQKSDNAQLYLFTYDYDAAGNRLKERKETTAGTEYDSAYYNYAADNSMTRRYSQFDNFTTYYYYDANGARIRQQDNDTGDTTYFEYYANQMIKKITPPVGDGNPWEMFYDGQLNRFAIDQGGSLSYYLWDGLNCLETRDNVGSLTARYTSGPTPIYGIGSYDEIIVPGAQNEPYNPAMDHRGTVMALLDVNRQVIATRDYNAYGEILAETGSWPVEEGYQSNWQTVTIGTKKWCLSAARVYDPLTGVFGQRDIYKLDLHFYLYCNNIVLTNVDPTGLAPKCEWAKQDKEKKGDHDSGSIESTTVEKLGTFSWEYEIRPTDNGGSAFAKSTVVAGGGIGKTFKSNQKWKIKFKCIANKNDKDGNSPCIIVEPDPDGPDGRTQNFAVAELKVDNPIGVGTPVVTLGVDIKVGYNFPPVIDTRNDKLVWQIRCQPRLVAEGINKSDMSSFASSLGSSSTQIALANSLGTLTPDLRSEIGLKSAQPNTGLNTINDFDISRMQSEL